MPNKTIYLTGENLSIETLAAIATDTEQFYNVKISPKTKKAIKNSRNYIDSMLNDASDEVPYIYGVNTGFGANKHKFIEGNPAERAEKMARISYNLLISHAAGAGEKFPREIVRAAIVLRANTLVKGFSGIRLEVIEKLLELINHDITPVVPIQGSVGGSGDLAPLSHMAIVMVLNPYEKEQSNLNGFVEVKSNSNTYKIVTANEGMSSIGGIELKAKEGLALNNGTQFLTALTALGVYKAEVLLEVNQTVAALTLEALMGTIDSLNPVIHNLRPYAGQRKIAGNIRKLLTGSNIVFNPENEFDYHTYRMDIDLQLIEKSLGLRESLRPVKEPIQDVYSVRCTPQVLGACYDTIQHIKSQVLVEMNSVNDNPIINPDFPESRLNGKAISGGNFHGEPIAFCADFLKIISAEMGSISERRTAVLIDAGLNRGLPAFLSKEQYEKDGETFDERGMHSGLMISQYLAAALVSENKVLSHPASVDTIPTSVNMEDHVSMGTHGARQAMQILDNVAKILSVELLAAAQAMKLRLTQQMYDLYMVEERIIRAEDYQRAVYKNPNASEKARKSVELLIEGLNKLSVQIKRHWKEHIQGKGTKALLNQMDVIFSEHNLSFPIISDTLTHKYTDVIYHKICEIRHI